MFSACAHKCPLPVEPIAPPPRVIKLDPTPCHMGVAPDGVSLDTLTRVMVGTRVMVQLSAEEWRGVLRRDAAWQAFEIAARQCDTDNSR